ncbi:CYTH domain-containing protein [Utexia brackfieldae]|uniref:CYTH domain-containing protein n=1 Tax=Utexia brackfieldae TaxID=3074108 RepID=UPI00370DDC71
MAIEIELKFGLTPDGVNRLANFLTNYTILEQKKLDLTNTYYDTPDFQLQKNHCGLRVRGIQETDQLAQYEITVKHSSTGVAGLHARQEFNVTVDTPTLDLQLLPKDALSPQCDRQQLALQIKPQFTTHFLRHAYLIRYHDSEIELAFDQGSISHDTHQMPIDELELELKQGDVSRLFEFAAELSILGLRLLSQSKAARGYRLMNQTPLLPPLVPELKTKHAPHKTLSAMLKYWQKCEEFADEQQQVTLLYDSLARLLPMLTLLLDSLTPTSLMQTAQAELSKVNNLLKSRPDWSVWLYDARVTKLKLHLTQIVLDLQD